ncbi:MAG: hypothetical protein R6X17_04030 [Candidatus Competibacteraceae bacterium]
MDCQNVAIGDPMVWANLAGCQRILVQENRSQQRVGAERTG